ncbi:MAG: phosphate ABC transporter permease PstA [Actinomycetes bacterium]
MSPREAVDREVAAAVSGGGRDARGMAFQALLLLAMLTVLGVLVWLLYSVVSGALPVFSERSLVDFLQGKLSGSPTRFGVSQGIVGSVWILIFVAVFAFPLGVASAIYLEEYAADNRFARLVNVLVRNLAGVPAVVYGLLGLFVFKGLLGDLTGGSSLISAGLTMAVLVLPVVIITSAEAIRAVPQPLREGGFGLGATRWEVIRSQVLPYAMPGILTGTVLSFARALGEAAPLLIIGTATGLLTSSGGSIRETLRGSYTAMPMLVYVATKRPAERWLPLASAAALVLLVVLLVANTAAILARNHFEKRRS